MNDKVESARKPFKFSKLSVQIIFMHFISTLSVYVTIILLFLVLRALGIRNPNNEAEVEVWVRGIVFFLPIANGLSIMFLFGYAINRFVVRRIRTLNDATREVAKGNYDLKLEAAGHDEITELTESFKKMSAELKANEYLSKEFVRNVSHEYKNPISVIRAYGELLSREAENEDLDAEIKGTLQSYSSIIMEQCDRLITLSKSSLQLSLLESTTIMKKSERVTPAEQVREILRLTQVQWGNKNLKFDLQLEEIEVVSNAEMLYLVWQNLIGNAIKFSHDDGAITIKLWRDCSGLSFEISDNGVGIRDCDKDKIFTQFFMADASRNHEGSGLGLSIVKKIVEKLDGTISFESVEGVGTTFKVCIKT